MTIQQLMLAAYKKVSVAVPVDDYADARLIAHFNGANGSTNFVDSSPYNVAIASVNGAALSTASPLNGTASLLLQNMDQHAIATIPVVEFGGTQKWCFEWTCLQFSFSQYFSYFTVSGDGGSQLYCNILDGVFYVGDGLTLNNMIFPLADLGLATGTMYKMALSYDGTTYRLFVNGTVRYESIGKLSGSGQQLAIGARPGFNNIFDGKIDDFIVTMGSAKRIANYAV